VNEMYEGSIMNICIFKNANQEFISCILPYLKSEVKEKYEIVYTIDDIPEHSNIFLIQSIS
jgi:hypothetical protein